MSLQTAARDDYRRLVDRTAKAAFPETPPEGWLRTVRKALRMSGPQLAARLGVTRARVAQAEQAELSGAATIRSMQAAANALGCRFVYAIVPDGSVGDVVAAQAQKKAAALVEAASLHMALEAQALPEAGNARQIARLAREIAREMPPDLWTDG